MQRPPDHLERLVTRYRERLKGPIEGPGPVFSEPSAHGHGCPNAHCDLPAFATELELDEHYRATHMLPSPW